MGNQWYATASLAYIAMGKFRKWLKSSKKWLVSGGGVTLLLTWAMQNSVVLSWILDNVLLILAMLFFLGWAFMWVADWFTDRTENLNRQVAERISELDKRSEDYRDTLTEAFDVAMDKTMRAVIDKGLESLFQPVERALVNTAALAQGLDDHVPGVKFYFDVETKHVIVEEKPDEPETS